MEVCLGLNFTSVIETYHKTESSNHFMPSARPKATKPVDPDPDLLLINPDPDGQSMRLIQAVREAPLGPQVSGQEKQL